MLNKDLDYFLNLKDTNYEKYVKERDDYIKKFRLYITLELILMLIVPSIMIEVLSHGGIFEGMILPFRIFLTVMILISELICIISSLKHNPKFKLYKYLIEDKIR